MAKKQWKICDAVEGDVVKKFPEFLPEVVQLLHNRGLNSKKAIDEFLNPDYEQDLHDPFLLKDMDKGVKRLMQALDKKEKILIHGDYDADGVTGATLLNDALQGLGGEVEVYLPSRQGGGYGMNEKAVRDFAKQGVQLIISVDCGITNVKEVALAKKLGMDVVITDHHSVPEEIPEADAVINPSQTDDKYPFEKLAGVGVAFKFIQALKKKLEEKGKQLEQSEKWFLDLVAVGTVADCSPIIGENRTLVKYGLQVLAKTKRAGFQSLLDQSRVDRQTLSTHDIGFRIGPRLNAAGRLRHPQIALDLLQAGTADEALALAGELDQVNRERQAMTAKFMQEAEDQIGEVTDEKRLLVAHSETWPSGVVGLVAGKLCERHSRPVIVLEKKETHSTGSARSIAKFNIIEAIRQCDELLEKHGGHSQAAGCTVENKNLSAFAKQLQTIANQKLSPQDLHGELSIDAALKPEEINWDLHKALQVFEPHGFGNEKPRFMTEALKVSSVRAVGREGKHLKLELQSKGEHVINFPAIAFGLGDLVDQINFSDTIDVAYELEINEWNGNRELQLNVLDIRKHGD
ncbi:single-stranded-DNA-specific exonuclease RecJ [Patescibacteria group bacterium]